MAAEASETLLSYQRSELEHGGPCCRMWGVYPGPDTSVILSQFGVQAHNAALCIEKGGEA